MAKWQNGKIVKNNILLLCDLVTLWFNYEL